MLFIVVPEYRYVVPEHVVVLLAQSHLPVQQFTRRALLYRVVDHTNHFHGAALSVSVSTRLNKQDLNENDLLNKYYTGCVML